MEDKHLLGRLLWSAFIMPVVIWAGKVRAHTDRLQDRVNGRSWPYEVGV